MENLEEEDSNAQEMVASNVGGTEHSRLFGPSNAKTNILNLISNVFALVFVCYIFYQCFIASFSLFSFHPTCMSIGWLLLMVSAINSLSPGDFATEWLPIRLRSARHWVLQVCGLSFLVTGFIIILVNKHIHERPHFTSLHGQFGLASMVLVAAVSIGGLLALYSLNLKKYIAPVLIKIIHATFGILTFMTGCVTMCLAIFSGWWSFGEVSRYIALFLMLSVMILTVLKPTVKTYARIREKLTHIIRE